MSDNVQKKAHWQQLDGLRAIAVLGVLVHHFWKDDFFKFNLPIDFGLLGVQLFFVLSGFLITGILLRTRNSIDDGSLQKTEGIKIFYIRRSLRIFPIYYLVIFLSWFSGDEETKNSFLWLATYLTNYYFTFQGWLDTSTAHLWSLAVEEQFYLLWPALILFLPKRLLIFLIFTLILIGPIFRLYMYSELSPFNSLGGYILTFANTDSLGMGALLAYLENQKKECNLYIPVMCLFISLSGFSILYFFHISYVISYSLSVLFSVIFFACLVYKAKIGFKGLIGYILNNSTIRYIGKISYGIYLYHLFVSVRVPYLFKANGYEFYNLSQPMRFTILVFFTLVVSIVSWHLVEKPVMTLKRFFSY